MVYSFRKKFLVVLAMFVFFAVNAQKPNIIYIMTDDMGYGDLSSYGRKDYKTPNLDKLAEQGVKFINAYSAAPVCTPTRTAFMTGRYPARTPVGLREPLAASKNDSAIGLTPNYTSIASLLKTAGYHTAMIGKWHLGIQPEHRPLKNGFDYFYGILTGAADYISHKTHTKARTHDLYENNEPLHSKGYLTDLITDKVISFLKLKHDKPFFLALTYTAPHWPWQGRKDKAYPDTIEFTQGGSAKIYAEMMKILDDGIGKILETLDKKNLTKNTLIIFTNDNGGEKYSDNGGLSSMKMNLLEGGIRVPAIIRWPGKIPTGSVTNQVAITMDWSATILAVAGATPDKQFPLDGINLLPVVTGDKQEVARTLYWRTFQRANQKAIRDGNWKYFVRDNSENLFDLSSDPAEKTDLKNNHPEIFNRLKAQYATWEKSVLEPVPLQTK
jgi:arylsulfatase A-like enzyme